MNTYARNYRERNLEKIRVYEREWKRAWRKKNYTETLAKAAAWRAANPTKIKEYERRAEDKRLHTNHNKIVRRRASRSAWQHKNLHKKRAWAQAYRDRNRLALRVKWRIQALIRRRAEGICSDAAWQARFNLYGQRCAYCQCALPIQRAEIDHVIPIASGGKNWSSNLVPACRSCNAKKNTKRWKPILPACGENR